MQQRPISGNSPIQVQPQGRVVKAVEKTDEKGIKTVVNVEMMLFSLSDDTVEAAKKVLDKLTE
jgi:hypothetical protein